jgi:hypothetical protein
VPLKRNGQRSGGRHELCGTEIPRRALRIVIPISRDRLHFTDRTDAIVSKHHLTVEIRVIHFDFITCFWGVHAIVLVELVSTPTWGRGWQTQRDFEWSTLCGGLAGSTLKYQ